MATGTERSERLDRERAFHDDRFAEENRSAAGKYYAVDAGKAAYEYWVLEAARPQLHVLEYGCGKGSKAFSLAARGARVTGIDISFVGVEHAQRETVVRDTDARFAQMDAERLGFGAATFDVVCGTGILHHLDVAASVREIHRILRPGGEAVFYEPLGTNPLINLYRRLTPHMRTPDEHPLVPEDLALMSSQFREVEISYHNLLSLAGVVATRIPRLGRKLVAVLQRMDGWLFDTLPWTRRLAWVTVVRLRR